MKGRTLAAIVLAALVGVASAARADGPVATVAPASPSLAGDFGQGAEEVAARLRDLARSLSDEAAVAALEAEVDDFTRRTAAHWGETTRLLGRNLRTNALDSLTTYWVALHADLADVDQRIAVRVTRREAEIASLASLHDAWGRALAVARDGDAPAAVVDRIQSTVAAIDRVRPQLERRRARLLVLQDAVARAFQHCDDALARVADARSEAIARALTPQEPPVWQLATAGPASAGTFSADVATKVANVSMYVGAYRGRLALTVLVIAGLMLLLRRAQQRFAEVALDDGQRDGAGVALRTPYAAAILIGLLVTVPLRPNPPYEVQQVILLVVMTASTFVLRRILGPRLASGLYVACALLVVNVLGQLLEPESHVEQLLLMVEMSVMAALLVWAAVRLVPAYGRAAASSPERVVARALLAVLALGCGLSAFAAAIGYLDLADFLGIGLLSGLLLAVGLFAVRTTFVDLIGIALVRGPVARLRTVVRYRAQVERAARALLDAAIVALWVWTVLVRFQLRDPAAQFADGVLAASLKVGGLELPVAHVLAFAAVLVGVFCATRLLGTVLEEDVYARMTLPRGVPYALSTLTRYVLLLAGFLLALGALGLDLTRITVLVSALGLGLGFGLQQIMNNFVSGLILLFERPVQVGDSIQMDDLTGDVLRIGIRSSTVRTAHGAEVIVPNAKMIEEKVVNWTLTDRRRRYDLDLRVAGDVDVERVMALMAEVARRDPRVSASPPPEALLVRLGRKSTHFQLRFWTEDPHSMRVWSDLSVALHRLLRVASPADPPPT